MEKRTYKLASVTDMNQSFEGAVGLYMTRHQVGYDSRIEGPNKDTVLRENVNAIIRKEALITAFGGQAPRIGSFIEVDGVLQASMGTNAQGQAVPGLRFELTSFRILKAHQGTGPQMVVRSGSRQPTPTPQQTTPAPAQTPASDWSTAPDNSAF